MKTLHAARSSRSHRLEARISPDLKRLFQRAAHLQGVTLSDFLINSVRTAALQTLREHEVIRLSERDSILFAKALLSAPPPNRRLKTAFQKHNASIK